MNSTSRRDILFQALRSRTLKNASVEINEDGIVVVSGHTIMSGYLNDEESTNNVIREGKIFLSDLAKHKARQYFRKQDITS